MERSGECGGIGGIMCCFGYRLNKETNSCQKCGNGFSGINCTHKCPFPSFGDGCIQFCKCHRNHCNFISGCKENATDQSTVYSLDDTKSLQNGPIVTSHQLLPRDIPISPTSNSTWLYLGIFILLGFLVISLSTYIFFNIYQKIYKKKNTFITNESVNSGDGNQTYEELNELNSVCCTIEIAEQENNVTDPTYLSPIFVTSSATNFKQNNLNPRMPNTEDINSDDYETSSFQITECYIEPVVASG